MAHSKPIKLPNEVIYLIFDAFYDSLDASEGREDIMTSFYLHSLICKRLRDYCCKYAFRNGVQLGPLNARRYFQIPLENALQLLKDNSRLALHVKRVKFRFRPEDYSVMSISHNRTSTWLAKQAEFANIVELKDLSIHCKVSSQKSIAYESSSPNESLGYRMILERSFKTLATLSLSNIAEVPILFILSSTPHLVTLNLEGCAFVKGETALDQLSTSKITRLSLKCTPDTASDNILKYCAETLQSLALCYEISAEPEYVDNTELCFKNLLYLSLDIVKLSPAQQQFFKSTLLGTSSSLTSLEIECAYPDDDLSRQLELLDRRLNELPHFQAMEWGFSTDEANPETLLDEDEKQDLRQCLNDFVISIKKEMPKLDEAKKLTFKNNITSSTLAV
ncbi:hypothetical protein CVT24_007823 [Panaeolus cyanescens]|uniref:F-box domain-containing protein n=1 Tax=Panaeolus cyanescens TaxID=181874 RepID=A0A409YQM3_9AGAR|nr:hypothetical protein CVT24_007823 [Panaeolus cyanescens]